MARKRIHELAKELGLESKVLIARLEKIGISVKTASSSLDENDYERAKEELTAGELREVVEQRIKTTVIRRRTVVTVVEKSAEEILAEEEERLGKDSGEEKLKKTPSVKADKVKKAKSGEVAAEEIPGQKPTVPEATQASEALPVSQGDETQEKEQRESDAATGEAKQPQPAVTKPVIIPEHKIIRPEHGKDAPLKPGEKMPGPSAEKPKKKGKYQVEVFIEEEKKCRSGRF